MLSQAQMLRGIQTISWWLERSQTLFGSNYQSFCETCPISDSIDDLKLRCYHSISEVPGFSEDLGRYSEPLGDLALRKVISDNYQDTENFKGIGPNNVAITQGATGAITLIAELFKSELGGKRVLIPTPSYPGYYQIFTSLGLTVHSYEANCTPFLDQQIEKLDLSVGDLLIVNSPHNPSGLKISRDALSRVVDSLNSSGGYLLVDSVYDRLNYESETQYNYTPGVEGAIDLGEQVFLVNSLSKNFGLPGVRVGWCVAPEKYSEWISSYLDTRAISHSPLLMRLALPVLTSSAQELCLELKSRRNILHRAITEIEGLTASFPSAGTVITVSGIPPFNAGDFAEHLLQNYRALFLPGTAYFGGDSSWFRVSFGYRDQQILQMLAILREGTASYRESF